MTSSDFELMGKLQNFVEIGSGDLCLFEGDEILVSTGLSEFSLHDALIYRYDFFSPGSKDSLVTLHGLLPCFSHSFKITFFGVSNFEFKFFSFSDIFSVKELRLKKGKFFRADFDGDFDGQIFSLDFRCAEFNKYRLQVPMTRSDFGF